MYWRFLKKKPFILGKELIKSLESFSNVLARQFNRDGYCLHRAIPKQPEESVSAGVGQPQNLRPLASLNFLSLAASAPALPGANFGRLLGIFPILQVISVYINFNREFHKTL